MRLFATLLALARQLYAVRSDAVGSTLRVSGRCIPAPSTWRIMTGTVPALGLAARNCSHTGYGRLNRSAGHEVHLSCYSVRCVGSSEVQDTLSHDRC